MHICRNVHPFPIKISLKDAYTLAICIFFRNNLLEKMHTSFYLKTAHKKELTLCNSKNQFSCYRVPYSYLSD